MGVDQFLLYGTPKRRSVIILLAEDLIVNVRVGIKMDEADGPILLRHRPQLSQRDGMVPPQGDRKGPRIQYPGRERLDGGIGRVDITGHDIDIPHIRSLQVIENIDLMHRIVRLHHDGDIPYALRPETGTRTIGTRGIERDAINGKVQPIRFRNPLHPHKIANVAKTRRSKCCSRLFQFSCTHNPHTSRNWRSQKLDPYHKIQPKANYILVRIELQYNKSIVTMAFTKKLFINKSYRSASCAKPLTYASPRRNKVS